MRKFVRALGAWRAWSVRALGAWSVGAWEWVAGMGAVAGLLGLGLLMMFLCGGCGGNVNRLDRWVGRVETNWTPQVFVQTNVVTNVVTVVQEHTNTVVITNAVGAVVAESRSVTVTNVLPVIVSMVSYMTNQVPTYTLVDKSSAETGASLVGNAIGMPFGVPFGGALLVGILHLYTRFRNSRLATATADRNAAVQASLVQGIETAREVMAAVPEGGQSLADRYTEFLKEHQRAAGVIDVVAEVVKASTDNRAAQAMAGLLVSGK